MAIWFITGCSSGFGAEITKAALAHGDKVIATARNASKLSDLQTLGATALSLDVNAPAAEIEKVVAEAVKVYGTIDILVNNAGYLLEGAVEEASDEEARAQFNTNVFGHLAVTRAVLPYMRNQKSGTIANIGSIAGWSGFVGCGYYCGTKFALAGFTEALRDEVAHLNIKVTIIEPGYFRTNFLNVGLGARPSANKEIEDYKTVMEPLRGNLVAYDRQQPGDPVKGSKLIVEALTGTGRCVGKALPPRLLLGSDAVTFVSGVLDRLRKDVEEWKELSMSTNFET